MRWDEDQSVVSDSSGLAQLRRLFDNPPASFGPTPLWWWSGERVTRDRLEWQLRRFHEGGIDNLVVINLAPAGPLFGAPADDPQWFSEEWWARFTETCEIAKSLGMHLWFYDQIGFSGANLQGRITNERPLAAGQTLRAHTESAADGRVGWPPGGKPLAAFTQEGSRVNISQDGSVEYRGNRPLTVISVHPTAFDYLNPSAVELLLNRVHREFERRVPEYLGSVIAGSFQDELPSTNPWSSRFGQEFLRRRGYDLIEHLPALFSQGDVKAAKVRTDYYQVRAELTQEAFFEPLGRWHEEHGLLLGADQSNPARAGYPLQSTQIYTDYFRTHRWYSAVGSDHEGDSKVHSSMAHLYGHDRVWLEAFHSSGWGGTLEETWDWLLPFLRSGATLYNPHASYFSTVGGWFEWAPPSTDWRQPYWRLYPTFSRAVARVTALMSWGHYEADVALLHPTTTMQAGLPIGQPVDYFLTSSLGPEFAGVEASQDTYLALAGTNDWFRSRPGLLDQQGVSFDVIDDSSIQRAESSDGFLRVASQAYRVVVLPQVSFLEEGTAAALIRFLDAGGQVVMVGPAPRYAAGAAGDDTVVDRLVAHPRCCLVDDPSAVVNELNVAEQHARSERAMLVRRLGETSIALIGGAFPNASGYPLRTEPGLQPWTDYDFDRDRYANEQTIRIQGQVAEAEIWDPARGTQTPASFRCDGEESIITAVTGGAPITMLVWREDAGPAVPPTESALDPWSEPVDISHGWTGELVPTMDNSWGDLARPVGRPLTDLQIWTTNTREESQGAQEEWRESKVTFGQRLLVHKPSTHLPSPLTPGECIDVAAGAPLGGPSWVRHEYSASRGQLRDHVGALGTKGAVPSEFVIIENPRSGELAAVRALLITGRRGAAELVISSSAEVSAWWNGVAVPIVDQYVSTASITLTESVNVLEYRLGPSRSADQMPTPSRVRSSFTLAEPGGFTRRPEYMMFGGEPTKLVRESSDGVIAFRTPVPAVGGLREARLVVGSACAATVLINDEPVARQEKVEYYESVQGSTPAFFSHNVTDQLTGLGDWLEIRLDSSDPLDVAYADLVLFGSDGSAFAVSGLGWDSTMAGLSAPSAVTSRQWAPIDSSYAARRPHPLPEAGWLCGDPELGSPVMSFAVTDSAVPARQEFEIELPAGTAEIKLPLLIPAQLTINGRSAASADNALQLDQPLQEPAQLTVITDPTTTHRGGAAWAGPIEVRHARAPITLGQWRENGLASWSGGLRYQRTIDLPADHRWRLDLGGLRGAVEISIDGILQASAFCAPFQFEFDPLCIDSRTDGTGTVSGIQIEITVYNTLGPFLHDSTVTTWVFPSQLISGLFGPVTLSVLGCTRSPRKVY